MTASDDLEARIGQWMADVSAEHAPGRVLESAQGRSATARQVRPIPGLGRLVGPFATRGLRWSAGLVAVAAVVALAVVGPSTLSGLVARSGAADSHPVAWHTDVVTLSAADLMIDAGGQRYVGVPRATGLNSDPGNLTYWTLEAEWGEHDREMRLYVYFAADDHDWWASEIRTRDGRDPADWIYYRGPFFKTPLGQTFVGDIDLSSSDPVPGRLVMRDVRIAVHPQQSFVTPAGDWTALTSDPFASGGPLRCSGILQLAPDEAGRALLAKGYAVSWRLMDPTSSDIPMAAPDGVIFDTAIGTSGELIMFVAPTGGPGAKPAAARPTDCPGASPAPSSTVEP
jgi:hypothetical protein